MYATLSYPNRKLLREQMTPHIVAEGWLTKLGTERKVFRKRYCLLLPDQLRWYADAELYQHKGQLPLVESSVGSTSPQRMQLEGSHPSTYPHTPDGFSFDVRTPDTTVVLIADSERPMRRWLNGLATLSQQVALK